MLTKKLTVSETLKVTIHLSFSYSLCMRGGRLTESLDRDTLVTIYFVTEESKSHPGRRSYRLTRKEISRLACLIFSGFVSLTLF